MAFNLAQRLQNLGVATQLGLELQSQISSGVGSSRRLQELGIVPELADYIEATITPSNAAMSAVILTRYGMVPEVARLIARSANAPRNTAVPTITGTAQVGETLTRTTGTWAGSPTPTYATAWLADGVVIAGETGATYDPVVADEGKKISVRITASNANGSAVAVSTETAAVVPA